MKALGRPDTPHLFADTTLESPDTYQYLQVFSRQHPRTPLLRRGPQVPFAELCAEIGPPSRIQRWCCTTHKMVPLRALVESLNGGGPVVTFVGVRAMESMWRSNMPRVSAGEKIAGEIVARPILDWSDLDVWLLTLVRGLPVNAGYRKGFTRMGCIGCPMTSQWSDVLSQFYYPDHMQW